MQIPYYLTFIEAWVYGHTECVKSQILYPVLKSGTSPGDVEYVTAVHQEAAISAPRGNPVTKQNKTYLSDAFSGHMDNDNWTYALQR